MKQRYKTIVFTLPLICLLGLCLQTSGEKIQQSERI
jgi:hypothetical protein